MSPSVLLAVLLVLLAFLWSFVSAFSKSKHQRLPPDPRPLPIIGNLHMLGTLPHRSLHTLAKKYGPIMSIHLGNVPTIVVSSPKAAELFLKTHDTNFASRPKIQASEYLSYGTKGMAFSEYGSYWRHMRKVCTLQLFCPAKLEVFARLRKEEVGALVAKLKRAAGEGGVVVVSENIGQMNEDITYRMVLGCKRDDRFDLKALAEEILFLTGTFNISDFVPSLGPLVFRKLPPGPRPLPIIGNLHMLGNLPYRSLQQLAKKYGSIMSIRLGNVPTIVVSSPEAAELFLKTHDNIFASRPKVQASEYMSYGRKGMAFTEYGPYWRHIRKLCTIQLLCPAKIQAFAALRKEEVGMLVTKLQRAAADQESGGVVDVSKNIGMMNDDITCRMVLGVKRDDKFDLKAIVEETFMLTGAFNISDFVPSLAALDLQGLAKRMKKNSKMIDQLLDKIIDDHEQAAKTKSGTQAQHEDFVDVLLSLTNQPLNPNDEQVHYLDRTNVKAILLDMISAASDTSASSIVWTLSQLLKHPRVMKNLQEELQTVVGMDRMVEESDLPKLDYLSMVVKESLRLHPVGPLLIPHESIDDVIVDGYDIPKKSRIIVNVWSIGRDPNVWSENVDEFFPERFEKSNIDLRGHDFQLIPFGSGRRGCPGMQLAVATVRLVVAQLVHCFNWKLPTGMLPQDLDMLITVKSQTLACRANLPSYSCVAYTSSYMLSLLCKVINFMSVSK